MVCQSQRWFIDCYSSSRFVDVCLFFTKGEPDHVLTKFYVSCIIKGRARNSDDP
jgi:hypothetical protein